MRLEWRKPIVHPVPEPEFDHRLSFPNSLFPIGKSAARWLWPCGTLRPYECPLLTKCKVFSRREDGSDVTPRCPGRRRHVFSAKGAGSCKPGATPQEKVFPKP